MTCKNKNENFNVTTSRETRVHSETNKNDRGENLNLVC